MTTLFSLLILTLLITAAIAGHSAAPWVPARKHDIERFLNAGEVTTGDTVFDLGCGDGRLVGGATRRGANASGFEISLFPYILAKIRGIFLQKKAGQYSIHFKNFWSINITEADVLFLFLMPKVLPKMQDKIIKEAKPGTRIVSYVWPLPDFTPVRIDKTKDFPTLYIYQT